MNDFCENSKVDTLCEWRSVLLYPTVTALLGGLALTRQIPRSLGAEFKLGLSLK